MSEVEQPPIKRGPGRPPKIQPTDAVYPGMAEVQSPDIAKAEQALEDYREAQKPPADEPESPAPETIEFETDSSWVLKGGIVVPKKLPKRVMPEQIVINRTGAVSDEQWADLKLTLGQMGVRFQAGVPR